MNGFMKRLLTVVVALFILIYVGYQGFQIVYSPIETETVYKYNVYETVDTKGMVIRNETLIPNTVNGYIFYTAENGSRVSQGGSIADIYPSETDAFSQQTLNSLDTEIAELNSIQAQGTANRVNLDLINTQINNSVVDLVTNMNEASISDMNTLRNELLSLLNKRQMTIGTVANFDERIAALTAARTKLASSFQKSTGSIPSPVAGYFVSSVDGFENWIGYDNALTLTAEQIKAAMESEPVSTETKYVGKVVGDYKWYLACVVPIEEASKMSEGAVLSVLFPFVSDKAVPVTVVSSNRDSSGSLAVVFKCDYMSKELSSIRDERIQIQVQEHVGLRVPSEAIRTDASHQTGAYVRVGNVLSFRKLNIVYTPPGAGYSICEESKESGYLKLYDEIIVEGKGLYDGKTVR